MGSITDHHRSDDHTGKNQLVNAKNGNRDIRSTTIWQTIGKQRRRQDVGLPRFLFRADFACRRRIRQPSANVKRDVIQLGR